MELAGIPLGGGDVSCHIAAGAVWTIDLFAQDGVLAEGEQHAAQRVGQGERGGRAIGGADQVAGQAGGVGKASKKVIPKASETQRQGLLK